VTCPSCGQALPSGPHTRCPQCAALLAVPGEGALAPNPHPLTPPARDKQEPLREIPGMRKRERTWKDEVRERVRHRHQQRAGTDELPLFRDSEEPAPEDPPAPPESAAPADASAEERYASGPRELDHELPEALDDLPLRRLEAPPEPEVERDEPEEEPAEVVTRDDDDDEDEREWRLEAPIASGETRPVERPAQPGERVQAALVDVILLLSVWGVVVYFASRAARVGLLGLRPSWPYLFAYLAFLGLAYAACFTGITGQTLGKMLKGLRVVTANGRPPGFPRAFFRAALGSLGVVLAFGGVVPMFFDPARRGLHDRLLKTRVVKG
jgi:uncharacterized RDD family membrane protein YckC